MLEKTKPRGLYNVVTVGRTEPKPGRGGAYRALIAADDFLPCVFVPGTCRLKQGSVIGADRWFGRPLPTAGPAERPSCGHLAISSRWRGACQPGRAGVRVVGYVSKWKAVRSDRQPAARPPTSPRGTCPVAQRRPRRAVRRVRRERDPAGPTDPAGLRARPRTRGETTFGPDRIGQRDRLPRRPETGNGGASRDRRAQMPAHPPPRCQPAGRRSP